MKKILFISWDGYHTTYAEGLFMPIFNRITELSGGEYQFHYLQFSNAGKERVAITEQAAKELNISYEHSFINRYFPVSSYFHLSAFINLFNGHKVIKKLVQKHQIDILMPRSVFPAYMVNKLTSLNKPIVYDADGLAIEERVDFQGLKKNSFRYKLSVEAEKKILENADQVITRSEKSIDIHLNRNISLTRDKFTTVYNGRDIEFFSPSEEKRKLSRKELGVKDNELLFVYSGSLGKQYGWEEMVNIVRSTSKQTPTKWLILTVNREFAQENLPKDLEDLTLVKRVDFTEMPAHLNAADIALAVRKPSFSMQGTCPIKLGEYLLLGLPTIASLGIGDTEEMLVQTPNCFVFDHNQHQNIEKAVEWVLANHGITEKEKEKIRDCGINFFSLDKTATKYLETLKKCNSRNENDNNLS